MFASRQAAFHADRLSATRFLSYSSKRLVPQLFSFDNHPKCPGVGVPCDPPKSRICHSYENDRGVPLFFPFWELRSLLHWPKSIFPIFNYLHTLCANQPARKHRISCIFRLLRTLAKTIGDGVRCQPEKLGLGVTDGRGRTQVRPYINPR